MWSWWRISFCAAPFIVFAAEWAMISFTLRKRLPWWLFALGLVGASKFIGYLYLGGQPFNPELPLLVLIVWGWMESVVWVGLPVSIFAALFFAVWNFIAGRTGWFRPSDKFIVRLVVVISMALAVYGMWEGMRVAPVVEREIEVDDLPAAFEGYRIAHLSDLHCSSAVPRARIEAVVERVNATKPDLIAITGDFVDGKPDLHAIDLEPIKDLKAADGVLACTGNHEKYWPVKEWEPYYEKWNVRLLRNSWTEIHRGNDKIVVCGMDDPVLGARPSKAFIGAPEGFRMLLFHRPIWCEIHDYIHGVRLQLSGHTHGGVMPIISKFVAANAEGHVRGIYRTGKLVLHNSPGTGQWAGFPLRFFNPPEITILRLKRRNY